MYRRESPKSVPRVTGVRARQTFAGTRLHEVITFRDYQEINLSAHCPKVLTLSQEQDRLRLPVHGSRKPVPNLFASPVEDNLHSS